jgi:hypothetical protein
LITDIQVSKWKDIYDCRDRIPIGVQIYGAVICGGVSPYSIEAFYKDGPVHQPHQTSKTVVKSSAHPLSSCISPAYQFSIAPTIVADVDRYVTIIIKSDTLSGEPQWQGDLLFPSDPSKCP